MYDSMHGRSTIFTATIMAAPIRRPEGHVRRRQCARIDATGVHHHSARPTHAGVASGIY
jgi:hypothetical protein